MSKLKRCPFCGGEAELDCDNGFNNWFVKCKECGCKTPTKIAEYVAIEAWNTRVPMERIIERLEERIDSKEDERERARIDNPLRYEMCDSYIGAMNYAIEIIEEELKP